MNLTNLSSPLFWKTLWSTTTMELTRAQLEYKLPVVAIILVALFCIHANRRRIWAGLSFLGRVFLRRPRRQDADAAEDERTPFWSSFVAGAIYGLLLMALFLTAVLAMGNYNNFGKWRYGSFLNAYEFYHYYLGTKYAREIGYEDQIGRASCRERVCVGV